MAYKYREEIVGKRFLSVSGFTKLKVGKINEWGWRAGVIRASSHKDNTNKELQVLVEYDDVEWDRREWISIYKDSLFHLFLVEQGLFWAERTDPFSTQTSNVLWPTLTFTALVSTVDMPSQSQPVEFLLDGELAFKDYKQLKPFQEWNPSMPGVRDYPDLRAAVRRWVELQDGQRILLATPSVLVGYRVEVYRAEGTTQWYTAVIVGYNEATRDLTVTDDTVLEEHSEDPCLVQMRLIGDGVVESIMRGENVGITPRRSRSAVLQTQHQQQPSRVNRAIAVSGGTATSVNTRKLRTGKVTPDVPPAVLRPSPEPVESKGTIVKAVRKRKTSENETSSAKLRNNHANCDTKEDLENKQVRKRNWCNRGSKKKVLEEANNSKLRDVQVRVEDCLQIAQRQPVVTLSGLCRQEEVNESVTEEEETVEPEEERREEVKEEEVRCDDDSGAVREPVQVPETVVSEEDDCVIVADRTATSAKSEECSSRGDDDGPLSSSSPFSRMELSDTSGATLLRFPDDRSDSGVSSLRSGSCASGDERSGSRSSALSSSDEPQHSQQTNRSPLFIPASSSTYTAPVTTTEVRVWRDPLLLEAEPHVRHIQSVQHQTLLMSHPSTPASSAPPPPVSSGHSGALYPPVVPSAPLIPPLPLHHHPHSVPHLPPPGSIYTPVPDMLWKNHYPLGPGSMRLGPQSAHHEEILERERAFVKDRLTEDRLLRERREHEVREIEKHHHKERERERLEREREREKQMEKEKQERERQDRLDREQQERVVRENQEKERAAQAVQKHFEDSFRILNQKSCWNRMSAIPPPISRSSSNAEEERKRAEHEHHQREQQRHLTERIRQQDARDRTYYTPSAQRPPSKTEYPPPAHSSRLTSSKTDKVVSVHAALPKAEPNFNVFGYPAYQPSGFVTHDPKNKMDHKLQQPGGGLVVTKSTNLSLESREREMMMGSNPPQLMNELKNSVIVKHEGKSPHHMEPKGSIAHSQSPKLRGSEVITHYMPSGQAPKGGMYEYRSPTQSPHHLAHPHTPSPHHHMEPQNLGKSATPSHHRSSHQQPSPHHQRQSPHPHSQPHPSPEPRYSRNDPQSVAYTSKVPPVSYGYIQQTSPAHYSIPTGNTLTKPKVSSPAPHHIYGKPSAGIGSGVPVCRVQDVPTHSSAIPLTSKPPLPASVSPSPYQQVSQYHPPHNLLPHSQSLTSSCLPPPPAHSSRPPDSRVMYERIHPFSGSVPGSKPQMHGTSPPTATAAPSPVQRSQMHHNLVNSTHSNPNGASSVQTQPLDLGVSANRCDVSPKRKATPLSPIGSVPVSLEVKKLRTEPPIQQQQQQQPQLQNLSVGQPQLSRVSEPSPLIASAATTITTVVNTAAYRTSAPVPVSVDVLPPDISVTAVPPKVPTLDSVSKTSESIASVSVKSSSPTPTLSPTPAPVVTEAPATPVKIPITPSVVDSEKSNSPGPMKTSNYPVRHLKKAWLQRHTGEDVEDTTGVTGGGSCVTLPLNIPTNSTTTVNPVAATKESTTVSLHNVGSMAVNSISKAKNFTAKKVKSKETAALNGHAQDSAKADDSSSSDQERGRKSPPKRKPPKVKRKKGGVTKKTSAEDHKKRKVISQSAVSESGSDSDKESGSEKDSDSGASLSQVSSKKANGGTTTNSTGKDKEPRKRGRRPKTKNDKGEEPRNKKSREDSALPQRDPFRKPPIGQLKKTGESFLQDGPCFEVAPKLAKCRECRMTPNQRSKNMPNIFCRFYAFRRLRYTKNGQLAIAGFSDPHKDALESDLKLWLPSAENPPTDLDLETSRFLLCQVGDHFCDLLVQEKEAHAEHMAEDKTIAWKRVVQGVREMCDVCETTLFNIHWACGKCGFVVCLDCYKGRKNGTIKIWGEFGKDRDEFSWLFCTNRQAHEQEKLMLTQIIAGDSLLKLGRLVHEVRELWNIDQYCSCPMSKEVLQKAANGARKEITRSLIKGELNGIKTEKSDEDLKSTVNGVKDEKTSPLSWLADVALSNEDKKNDDCSSDSDVDKDGNFSTLRELLIRPSHKPNGSRATSPTTNTTTVQKSSKKFSKMDTLDEVISSVIEDSVHKGSDSKEVKSSTELKHFVRRYNWATKGREVLPIRIMTLTESKILYPDVPHSWLCDGKLLRLLDPQHSGNSRIFRDQWKRGQPVIVSDVTKSLNPDLWHPDSFSRDFGDEKNDLVNCMNGNLVPNQPMRKFWEGFDNLSKRLKDDRGNPMLLKLKDWPPGEDFAEMLPTRFSDLMTVLPLPEYTHRSGKLNLAGRLPDCFVRPDLGPKMYNAYGSALYPTKGTTNLHLDISDAVNVMVYVGIPNDGENDEHIKEAFRAIDEAGCDILTRRRVRDKGELPGALWHIYNPRDADKIRDLLNKVAIERGARLEPHHDPIHDQSCYLDGPLRERLYKEYEVEGYAIVQCLGDAVFIPAGAPHQVRNLHNCIKVAEDFVSPENVSHCFHLTQEFRELSDSHTNHEDKLQIKNIIYHAVKDSLSALSALLNKHMVKKEEEEGDEDSGSDCAAASSPASDSKEPA